MKSILAALAMAAAIPAIAQSETPRCTEPRQCEVMWAAAQDTVGQVSTMRIRMATDTRIETYGPIRSDSIAIIATKVPAGDKGYEFRIQVDCLPSDYCTDMRGRATRVFNSILTQAGS